MRRIFKSAALAAASILLAACQLEFIDGERVNGGTISLNVEMEGETKAAMTETELLNNAMVRIYMGDHSGLIREYKYSQLPSSVYLPTDSYRVDVAAGELAKATPAYASWEQKSYKGSTDFEITPGGSTNVKVVASVANVMTQVNYDQTVKTTFSKFSFSIGTSSDDASRKLVYDSTSEGKTGYFILDNGETNLYWTFNGNRIGSSGVEQSGMIEVAPGKLYTMTLSFSSDEGKVGFGVKIDNSTEDHDDVIIFNPISTGLAATPAYEVWAGHLKFYADVDESEYSDPSAISFEYSMDGSHWKSVGAKREGDGVYTAEVGGLDSATEYTYKLIIAGEEVGDSRTIFTDDALQLPNYGFEYTSNDESSRWTSFYDPKAGDPDARYKWWDNGSSASAGMLGSNYAICHSDTDVPAGIGSTKSAKLTSISAAGKLAAGNLFSGEFAGLDGLNGKVNFGRPWTLRPTAVRLWYKYIGGKVDKAGGPTNDRLTTSDYDRCQIKVALGTWDNKSYGGSKTSPVQVNTSKKDTFWDYTEIEGTVAYGDFVCQGDGKSTGWQQITIPLEYYTETVRPTHIIFSAAASIYGDYFAGSSGSILWLDEVELLYD